MLMVELQRLLFIDYIVILHNALFHIDGKLGGSQEEDGDDDVADHWWYL